MNVLHVINSLILAGSEILLAEMLPRLRERGIGGELVVLKRLDSPLEDNLRAAGFRFLDSQGSEIYSPFHIASLAKHISSFDVVHSYLFPSQLSVAVAACLSSKSVPLVTTEAATYNRRRRGRWGRRLDVWMYRNYNEIVCNSRATAESLIQWVPEVADRVSVVYNGVSMERFQNAEAPDRALVLPTAIGKPILMFVARFDPSKDHPTLLRALRRVPGAELVLVGDGDSRPIMERLACELGIRERVHFFGRRANVPELLKLADLYVHASNFEGFGVAALEAMSAGLPVIATDVPGLNEVVKGTGMLVPSRDEEALADAIRQVLQSQQIRQRMAAASRERAMQFTIERMVESFIKIYQSAVCSREPAHATPVRLT